MRASIRRGIKDKLVEDDPTDDIVVKLGHREAECYSSEQLMAIYAAGRDDVDRAMIGVLGLMGLRSGEARSLRVGDFRGGHLSVKNGGAGTDTTKTRASRRVLPVPALLLPVLARQAGDRSKSEWLFPSPRKTASGNVGRSYPGQVLTRCVARANEGREEKIPRLNVHSLRHTFASMAFSEAEADIISVSHALGHARSSIRRRLRPPLAKGPRTAHGQDRRTRRASGFDVSLE